MILEGKKNMDTAACRRGDLKRQAVTPLIMKLLKAKISRWEATLGDKLMVWATCTLLFHGAFRGAELLSRNTAGFDPAFTLLRRDVSYVADTTGRAEIQVKLKAPKEDKRKS
jgi:predicted membrane protein